MISSQPKPLWDSLAVYAHKRVLSLFALGFSSGLPLALVFGTLSFWLREAGIERATIGFLSWVALTYSFKFLWAPLVDRLPLPLLTALLGRRRSWLLLTQLLLMAALAAMAATDPQQDLSRLVLLALLVAFASATQDIVVDAFRIEAAPESMQAALAAAYQMGYRLAMIASGAGALAIAAWADPNPDGYHAAAWQTAYLAMAALMLIGLTATLMSREPQLPVAAQPKACDGWQDWLYQAFVAPFADFFQRYGKQALLILALIATYRLADIVMGVMANVFYVDMGYSKGEIAAIAKVFGVLMTLLGAAIGGALVYRFGTLKVLFLGGFLVAITNLLFAWLASVGHNLTLLTVAISIDNFSAGIATSAFIAYLSSLTNIAYSATQYALLSSMMLLFPKFVAGFSGVMVDSLGYVGFFVAVSIMGLPVLVLIAILAKHTKNDGSADTAQPEPPQS
ncbi:AmpG family muropeptide MFS transporter [Ferrimonas senticii]|uniref:AmpG family muropeptide MFS transporter n=1 Tax=Ferrimonas senticii TaxID=394566 RepID=UPI0004262E54|nr:AmpG family muropeptide MFS transporter [Ferrimonas senticii]